jgi:hypothetical protein
LPHVQQLVNIFESLHNDIRITEVWFLKKKDKGDEFENFHHDYKNIGGGSNDVSFTVNVNLRKLNEANDIATMYISPSNEEPFVLIRSRKEELMQTHYLYKKKKRSINYHKKIYIVSSSECCIQKTLIITWITCKNKMK